MVGPCADLLVEHVTDASEGGRVEQAVDVQRQRGVEVRDDARVARLPAPRPQKGQTDRRMTHEEGALPCGVHLQRK